MIKKSISLSLILSSTTTLIMILVNVASIALFNTMPFAIKMNGGDCTEYIGPLMDVTRVYSNSPDLSSKLLLNIEYHPITLLITFLVLLPIYFGIAMLIYKSRAKKNRLQKILNNEQ